MIKEHKINKQDNMFINGYYIPHKIVDPFVKLSKNFSLRGGAQRDNNKNLVEWDGEQNHNKECFDYPVVWPTCNDPIIETLLDHIQISLDKYLDNYPLIRQNGTFMMNPAFNYQQYPKGKSYNIWHYERANSDVSQRMLVWMMYLNECKDGGETAFLYQKYKMKPEKGLLLFWPTDFTHVHRGLPSFKTEKKIITGWYSFIENNPPDLRWS
tara:strand:- start:504 stop:1136 length:633 start_codon:yes stop_codon:yes gene_type:complete